MERKNKILVTGGAGFIGSNIVRAHLEKGDTVWALDNLETGRARNIEPFLSNPDFKFIEANLCHFDGLEDTVKWADRIYHMAANVGQKYVLAHPIETLSNNIHSCENLMKAMAQSKSRARMVIASTSELYVHSPVRDNEKVNEEMITIFPPGKFLQEAYPVSKLVNETMALGYVHQNGLDIVIARLFNTIGVNQSASYGMVVPNFVEQALSGRPITIFGDGLQTRSFSNVEDTVKALDLLLDNPKSKGEIVNVGDDRECSIKDLAHLVKTLAKSSSEIRYLTYKEAYGIDNFVDVRRRCPDLGKLKQLTGFCPKLPLERVINQVIDSYKASTFTKAATAR